MININGILYTKDEIKINEPYLNLTTIKKLKDPYWWKHNDSLGNPITTVIKEKGRYYRLTPVQLVEIKQAFRSENKSSILFVTLEEGQNWHKRKTNNNGEL